MHRLAFHLQYIYLFLFSHFFMLFTHHISILFISFFFFSCIWVADVFSMHFICIDRRIIIFYFILLLLFQLWFLLLPLDAEVFKLCSNFIHS